MNNFNYEPDPEVSKVRDQIIKKIGNKPLEEVNAIIKKLLNGQMDEITRLGALAARVKIIRLRIEELYETRVPKKFKKVETKNVSEEQKVPEKKQEDWVKVEMLEPSEVNGKQIDKGVILDVSKIDAQKLIENKKAIPININDQKQALDKEEIKKDSKLNQEVKSEQKEEKLLDQNKDSESNLNDKSKNEDEKKLENNNLEKKDDESKIDRKKENEKNSNEEKITKNGEEKLNKDNDDEKIKVQDVQLKKDEKDIIEKTEQKNDESATDENLDNITPKSSINNTEKENEINKDEADLLKIHEEKAKKEEK